MSNRNQNQQTQPLSQGISKYADIFFVVIVLIFVLLGVFIAVSISGKNDELIAALLLGVTAGALIGAFIGGFFMYLLKGLSVIVAWYEATPPGCACIMQQDTSDTPSPKSYVPDVPVAHHEKPDAIPDDAAPAGYWKCLFCGKVQPTYVNHCRRCGSKKPKAASAAPPDTTPKKTSSATTAVWLCTCGTENPVSRGSCEQCGGAKPYRN